MNSHSHLPLIPLLLVLTFLSVISTSHQISSKCMHVFGEHWYDLNKLSMPDGGSHTISNLAHTYFFNFCANVLKPYSSCPYGAYSGFRLSPSGSCNPIAPGGVDQVSIDLIEANEPSSGLRMKLGSIASISTEIRVLCNRSVPYLSSQSVVIAHGPGRYDESVVITIESKYGCPLSSFCSGNGYRSAPDECVCEAGFAGKTCQWPVCFGKAADDKAVCSHLQGTCKATDTCECREGYFGPKCQYTTCGGVESYKAETCSGRGRCVAPDACYCRLGRSGKYCQTFNWSGAAIAMLSLLLALSLVTVIVLIVLHIFSIRKGMSILQYYTMTRGRNDPVPMPEDD